MAFSLSSWWHRRQVAARFNQATDTVQSHRVVNPYHAVSIKPGPTCCLPAQQNKAVRYLSAAAPLLPLKGCPLAQCKCVYQHHDDRRSGRERRMQAGGVRTDRRFSHGRRATDHDA